MLQEQTNNIWQRKMVRLFSIAPSVEFNQANILDRNLTTGLQLPDPTGHSRGICLVLAGQMQQGGMQLESRDHYQENFRNLAIEFRSRRRTEAFVAQDIHAQGCT